MAISVVQVNTNVGNPPASFTNPVTVGNTVFLVAAAYTTNGSSVTSSGVKLGGNAISGTTAFFNSGSTGGVNSASDAGNVACVTIWMMPNIGVSGQTAVDLTTNVNNIGQAVYEVSGLGTSPSLDQSSSGSSISAATADSGTTGAITASPEFIIGGAMIFSGATAGHPTGFTFVNPAGGTDLWAGYQIATSSGGTYDWQQTSAGQPWAAALVTVAASLPPPAPVPVLYSMRMMP